LRDGLGIIKKSEQVEALAASVDSSEGVYFLPAFAGMGAPYWNQKGKGTIFGITRGTTDAHIARAALEAIAYQTMDILKAMQADSEIEIKELRVDGGASINDNLMQFQSEVLKSITIRPKITETTALGAAYLAGLAVGFWESRAEIEQMWQEDKRFKPMQDERKIEEGIKGWYRAVKALEYWTTL
jgi:glycerol kinase